MQTLNSIPPSIPVQTKTGAASKTNLPRFGGQDTVRFGNTEEAEAKKPETPEKKELSFGQKLLSGVKLAAKLGFSPKALLGSAAISALLSLVLFWLPGSQLLIIPAGVAISFAMRTAGGFILGYQGKTYEDLKNLGKKARAEKDNAQAATTPETESK